MKSSDFLVLIVTGASLIGAAICYLILFTKEVNYLRRADKPLKYHLLKAAQRNKSLGYSLTPAQEEALMA